MPLFLIALLLVCGLAFHVMSPEERRQALRSGVAAVMRGKEAALAEPPGLEPFRNALRERTRWAIATPIIVAVNVIVFVRMLVGDGAFGDPATIVAWGGNYGPRTTNGEWWRLVTATFVHSGMLSLLINIAGLVRIGVIVERLVGSLAFAAVYLAAGVFASLVSVSAHPLVVSAGAAGAIFGIYGLLCATSILSVLHRSPITIPRKAWKVLAAPAGVFILYNCFATGVEPVAEFVGFITGICGGFALANGVSEHTAPVRHVAVTMAAVLVIAALSAVPLRGLSDVRPTIAQLVDNEQRTTVAYDAMADRFKQGRVTVDTLTQLIERTILAELKTTREHLNALGNVPGEQKPLLASAEEYLGLREKSWRLRADALHKKNLLAIREAEKTERAAFEALERIKPTESK